MDPNTVGEHPGDVVRALAALGRPVVLITSIIGHEVQLLHDAGAAALLLEGVRSDELPERHMWRTIETEGPR